MANTSSAKKRVRRDARKTATNISRRSRIRTYIKKVEAAIEGGDKDAANAALREAQPELMRGVTRGVFKKNTAARKISRLSQRIKAI
ncbi:MAG: 30S ribosomal protein S20 [Rhodospirillaceae bacterium]|nr:30S ribosomal protein S20 [Rhodospirillaceae bacterium]RPG01233.1 MAG: 30S ribosomal protein S20 [Rhodospirillaceae bacterium TMED63]RZO37590.1 MAG: 30S ribosomal protein S20 [Rhodospirillaceae bacterium]|tara:strand:+ start:97 stop:357 length:261 start_codon:yes stop_codon:yes gene_type:complete